MRFFCTFVFNVRVKYLVGRCVNCTRSQKSAIGKVLFRQPAANLIFFNTRSSPPSSSSTSRAAAAAAASLWGRRMVAAFALFARFSFLAAIFLSIMPTASCRFCPCTFDRPIRATQHELLHHKLDVDANKRPVAQSHTSIVTCAFCFVRFRKSSRQGHERSVCHKNALLRSQT